MKKKLQKAIVIQKEEGWIDGCPAHSVRIQATNGTTLFRGGITSCTIHRRNTIKSLLEILRDDQD